MIGKSPAMIWSREVFQFLERSSRIFRPLWFLWSFASNRR